MKSKLGEGSRHATRFKNVYAAGHRQLSHQDLKMMSKIFVHQIRLNLIELFDSMVSIVMSDMDHFTIQFVVFFKPIFAFSTKVKFFSVRRIQGSSAA